MANSIIVGAEPQGVVFDPANGNIYVASFGDGVIDEIRGGTSPFPDQIPLGFGAGPLNIAFNPTNGYLYVTDRI